MSGEAKTKEGPAKHVAGIEYTVKVFVPVDLTDVDSIANAAACVGHVVDVAEERGGAAEVVGHKMRNKRVVGA